MSYGNSRKWIAPGVREKQKHDKLNFARGKICANSPFWHRDFDLENHKREFNALLQARFNQSTHPASPETPSHSHGLSGTSTAGPVTPSRSAFSGKKLNGSEFTTNHSPVLAFPTVFTPQFKLGKPFVAPWPSKSEMKYEGDDRIATDKLHGRFLGHPRVEGNETVNWQHRNVIPQYHFDNFHTIPSVDDIFVKTHSIPELQEEATEEEAKAMLGEELFELLDPVGRL